MNLYTILLFLVTGHLVKAHPGRATQIVPAREMAGKNGNRQCLFARRQHICQINLATPGGKSGNLYGPNH